MLTKKQWLPASLLTSFISPVVQALPPSAALVQLRGALKAEDLAEAGQTAEQISLDASREARLVAESAIDRVSAPGSAPRSSGRPPSSGGLHDPRLPVHAGSAGPCGARSARANTGLSTATPALALPAGHRCRARRPAPCARCRPRLLHRRRLRRPDPAHPHLGCQPHGGTDQHPVPLGRRTRLGIRPLPRQSPDSRPHQADHPAPACLRPPRGPGRSSRSDRPRRTCTRWRVRG
jgi:hypothetical protein